MKIPRRKPGRQSEAAQEKYESELQDFIQLLIRINDKVDFKMGSRDWCYMLEGENLITKGDFDYAQRLINDCRKNGRLPDGFIAQEEARSFHCVERFIDKTTPKEEAADIIKRMKKAYEQYFPKSFWEGQDYYVQMLVEKIGLRNLFMPICEKYKIPVATARGWSSIRQRKEMIYRFKENEEEGRTPVLLYCGDFDPAGFNISKFINSNLDELYGSTRWLSPDDLVDRFGLNYEFIIENNLTWIDNLETGNKIGINDLADHRHTDHNKEYVQRYLAEFGPRKVEANAIVKIPELGRKLCEDAINQYVSLDSVDEYKLYIDKEQKKVQRQVKRLLKNM